MFPQKSLLNAQQKKTNDARKAKEEKRRTSEKKFKSTQFYEDTS